MAYDRLADAIIKHSKLILVVWIVILLVAAVPAVKAFGNMSYDMNEMGIEESESMEGLGIIGTYFPSSSADSSSMPIVVIGYGSEGEHAKALGVEGILTQAVEDGYFTYESDGTVLQKITGITGMDTSDSNPRDDGSGIVMLMLTYSDEWDGSTVDDTAELRNQIHALLTEQGVEGEVPVYLTGMPAVSYDMETGAMEDISHIDVFTVLMILILVGLFFRSFITSAMPPVTMGVAFAVTMGLIYGLMYVMDIFFVTEVMLLVSMMGAGCDYCIFILARYREERRDGKDHHDALHSAIKWAGESITISGASVIIGFGAMSICSFSMISTMGICLALGIVVALFAALTFIPSLLNVVGDRIFWPTKMREYQEGGKATRGWFAWSSRVGHKYFDKSSRFTLKHAKAITVVAVLVTLPAAYVALTSETSYDMTSSLMTGDSESGMELLGEYADQGIIYPDYVVLEYDDPIATITVVKDPTGSLTNPLTGEPNWSLQWSDSWEGGLAESLDSTLDKIDNDPDDNISSVTRVFMWDNYVDAAMASLGIDESNMINVITNGSEILTAAQVAAISDNTSSALVLEEAMPAMRAQYAQYVSAGLLDEMFAPYLEEYQGLESILGYPVTLSNLYNNGAFTILGATNDDVVDAIIALSGAGTLDYLVNVNLGYVGGEYALFDASAGVSETTSLDVTYVKVSASTHAAAMAPISMGSISYMQGVIDEYVAGTDGIAASWITGTAVVMYDISEIISGEFTMIEILVIILIIVLLFFVMRSYTIPLRSVATILMSICWTLAATHLLFGDEVTWLIPLILLVICLGLGMDYDILLTTRIKENVRANGMSNDEAIHHAVVHSGSVITICGLIMGGAFGTLMLSSMGMLQQFGFALCFAILCDALIVRTYIVPAVMHLLGDWNWKGPRFLERIGGSKAPKDSEE